MNVEPHGRPAYFVVALCQGEETPCVYWDELPRMMPFRVEYILRLDEQPGADRLMRMPLEELLRLYQHRKRNGTLPPRWSPPPRKQGEKPKLLLGHHESSQRAVIERSRAKEITE